jgi:GTPase SAR1 family protein
MHLKKHKTMRITIINNERNEKRYTREELDEFVAQLSDGTFRQQYACDYTKDVCFAAEWQKQNGGLIAKSTNALVLLSLENLRDLVTVEEYKRLATQLPYTLLCFIGHDGHSLHIVCPYTIADGELTQTALTNAFRKLHYIYSSQLGTPLADHEPTFETCCRVSYDPKPYYNPSALLLSVSTEPEESPEFKSQQEDISDYNDPEEIPGLSLRASRMRRFHDCLDAAIIANLDKGDDELYGTAVLEKLADGCRQMGLPQAWAARVASFIPMLGGEEHREAIESAFKTAYLKETLKTVPMKYTRPSALLAYKTEAYMKEHYTLRLNVMTGIPEYRINAVGYGFHPLDQAARNTMAIKALKAGVDSWDKDLSRYIDSNLIPRYYPMEDYLRHLPKWNGKKDYVGELAQRIKTTNPYWESDFHTWMLSMVAQWLGKDRQHGNAIVPLLIGPQGSGKTSFCHRLLPGWLQTYYNDRISMKNDNDIFIAMSSYALINIDEFDAMSKSQQPILKYLISKHDIKFRPPYGKVMEERQRFASFIATTNNLRPLTDPTGSRRFVCVYADEIDNSGTIPYEQLYAQLVAELQQGRRYWFEDDENQRIMEQNKAFQQVNNYEEMVSIIYLSPEETPDNAKPVLLQDIMQRLSQAFPTFVIAKGTDMELGRRLTKMGYDSKRQNKGSAFRIMERPS